MVLARIPEASHQVLYLEYKQHLNKEEYSPDTNYLTSLRKNLTSLKQGQKVTQETDIDWCRELEPTMEETKRVTTIEALKESQFIINSQRVHRKETTESDSQPKKEGIYYPSKSKGQQGQKKANLPCAPE
ncbi:hypothetical protein Ahia01_001268200 [Argonauta hians]